MAERVVIWTDTASKQRREILRYWTIRNGSSEYAEKLIKLIRARIQFIIKNPDACKLSEFPNTRECVLGNYSIYYKMQSDQFIIMAFWDNRQDPKSLIRLL
jgi:plasmid stabilization system protein ParE